MKCLVIDDHAVVRAGVAAVLDQLSIRPSVFEAADLAAGLALAAENPDLDLVLFDLNLPGSSGIEALAHFGTAHPGIPVLVLSASESILDVRAALGAGALGYVAKTASPATLAAAINLVLDGQIYVPTFVLADRAGPAAADKLARLTARQTEILMALGKGFANKEIAYRFGLSEKTVKAHVTAILRALGVSSRQAAAELINEA